MSQKLHTYLNCNGDEEKNVARAQTRSTAARRNSSIDEDLDLSHDGHDNGDINIHINRGCKLIDKQEH